ncbi:MAG: type II toxin-antitoxin system Phd/YefM family antitoxin [Planctomycetota bacterium]|jgi:prevent-host-death family protein
MQPVRFTEDVRPISDLKLRAAEVVDQARRNHRPVLLTRRGRGVAVLLDVEDYERLSDRAAFVDAVEAGARSARDDKLHSDEEAMEILDSFGE